MHYALTRIVPFGLCHRFGGSRVYDAAQCGYAALVHPGRDMGAAAGNGGKCG